VDNRRGLSHGELVRCREASLLLCANDDISPKFCLPVLMLLERLRCYILTL
jgi:hypothetical protein